MPGRLRKQFGRYPGHDQPDNLPKPGVLMEHLDAIHRQAIDEVSRSTAERLREACEIPFCVYPTSWGL